MFDDKHDSKRGLTKAGLRQAAARARQGERIIYVVSSDQMAHYALMMLHQLFNADRINAVEAGVATFGDSTVRVVVAREYSRLHQALRGIEPSCVVFDHCWEERLLARCSRPDSEHFSRVDIFMRFNPQPAPHKSEFMGQWLPVRLPQVGEYWTRNGYRISEVTAVTNTHVFVYTDVGSRQYTNEYTIDDFMREFKPM